MVQAAFLRENMTIFLEWMLQLPTEFFHKLDYNGETKYPKGLYLGGVVMAAREDFYTKLVRWRSAAVQAGQTGLSGKAVQLLAEVGIHLTLGAVLAGGVIFDGCAPFGVAMVAASGTGLCGGGALLGAGFGYLTLLPFSDGLRYLSAAILTFAVAFAFYDVRLLRRPAALAILSGVMNASTGLVYLADSPGGMENAVYLLLETVLTVGGSLCFRQVLLPLRQEREEREPNEKQRISLLVMVCCVLISLSGLYLWEDVSLGRSGAVMCVLAGAWKGGSGMGAILGVSIGLAMDLAGGRAALYAMAWGVAALAAGSCRGKPRHSAAVAFVLANAAAVLWTWEQEPRFSVLYEVFFGSVTFMALPEQLWKSLVPLVAPSSSITTGQAGRDYVRRRLEETAGAFRSLYESLRGAFRAPPNDNDVAVVFDRAADRVCRKCSLRLSCWEREYVNTFNALNDATSAMLERGRGEKGDFPHHFADRCIHFPAFLEAVNQELNALLCRRQYQSRLQESRMAVCRQYREISSLLGRAAVELSLELTPDHSARRRLEQFLAGLGLELETEVFRDEYGRLHAHVRGDGWREVARAELLPQLERTFGVPLRAEAAEHELILVQLEPLMAVAGVAARKKEGETVCGDAGTYFKREDGMLYVLLCDGMGSGVLANRESTLAVRLLEQFLLAGVDTEHALITLNSALALRGEEVGGFTTVDLLQVDLFTGEASLYKLGAAPTYVRHGESVRKITGNALPAGVGVEGHSRPDCTRLHLEPGDCVLMVSDGVSGTGEDDWVRRRLGDFQGNSPKELARSLITDSPEGATDDRTALVVRIEKRT